MQSRKADTLVDKASEPVHLLSRNASSGTHNYVSQNTDWRRNYCWRQIFVAPPLDKSVLCFGTDKRARRRFDGLAYLCDDAGRTSSRAGRRAGPSRVSSKQAGTVAEESKENVHLASIKRLRSAETTRISSPAIICIWVSYTYLKNMCGSTGVLTRE